VDNICPDCKEEVPYKGTCTNCGLILYKDEVFIGEKNSLDRTYPKFKIYRTTAGSNKDIYIAKGKNVKKIMKLDRKFKIKDRTRIELILKDLMSICHLLDLSKQIYEEIEFDFLKKEKVFKRPSGRTLLLFACIYVALKRNKIPIKTAVFIDTINSFGYKLTFSLLVRELNKNKFTYNNNVLERYKSYMYAFIETAINSNGKLPIEVIYYIYKLIPLTINKYNRNFKYSGNDPFLSAVFSVMYIMKKTYKRYSITPAITAKKMNKLFGISEFVFIKYADFKRRLEK